MILGGRGIGVTPSGTRKLEVVATFSLTGNMAVIGDVDMSGNDLVIFSDSLPVEQELLWESP